MTPPASPLTPPLSADSASRTPTHLQLGLMETLQQTYEQLSRSTEGRYFLAIVDNVPKLLKMATALPIPLKGREALHSQLAALPSVSAAELVAVLQQRIGALDGAAVDAFVARWVVRVQEWRTEDGTVSAVSASPDV